MLNGKYQQFELDHIGKIRPEFKLRKAPSLDQVIVSFLAKYDVFVEPLTSGKARKKDNYGDAAIAIMGGPELGYDAQKLTSQKQQTKIQEWTQWKQWALDHEDFEAYRAEKIDKAKEKYFATLKKLEDPKVQEELKPMLDAFHKKINKDSFIFIASTVVFIAVGIYLAKAAG